MTDQQLWNAVNATLQQVQGIAADMARAMNNQVLIGRRLDYTQEAVKGRSRRIMDQLSNIESRLGRIENRLSAKG